MKRIWYVFAALFALLPAVVIAQEELPEGPEVPVTPPESSSILDGMLAMSNEALIMLVAGVVLSLVWSIFEKQTWAPELKALGFFAVCTLFGVIYSLIVDDDFTAGDIGRRILIILAAGMTFYLTFKGPLNSLEARSDGWLKRTPA